MKDQTLNLVVVFLAALLAIVLLGPYFGVHFLTTRPSEIPRNEVEVERPRARPAGERPPGRERKSTATADAPQLDDIEDLLK